MKSIRADFIQIYDLLNHMPECTGVQWQGDAEFMAQCTDTYLPGERKWVRNDLMDWTAPLGP